MPIQLFQPIAVTFGVTAAAVTLSAAVTRATMWWVGYDAGYLPELLAGAIPAAMVPFTVYPLASANRRLRRMQGKVERIAIADLPNGGPVAESADAAATTGTR